MSRGGGRGGDREILPPRPAFTWAEPPDRQLARSTPATRKRGMLHPYLTRKSPPGASWRVVVEGMSPEGVSWDT